MRSFSENIDLAISFADISVIEKAKSKKQQIELFQHPVLGRILSINKEVQHVEKWQALYHEPLVHIPSAFIQEIKTVLVLGGGSLYAASEVFKYDTVERCVLVDHDHYVLDLVAQHYPHAKEVIRDGRFQYIEADAIDYLLETNAAFDLIINDCFDCVSVSRSRGISIIELLRKKLSKGGVCSDLIYRHLLDADYISSARLTLSELPSFGLALVAVPEFPGVLHLLSFWGSDSISQAIKFPINKIQQSWARGEAQCRLDFFNPHFLPFYLYLPPYVSREWLALPNK